MPLLQSLGWEHSFHVNVISSLDTLNDLHFLSLDGAVTMPYISFVYLYPFILIYLLS